MGFHDYLVSPLEGRSDDEWEDFVNSRSIATPSYDGQGPNPDGPSWISPMDEFMDDFQEASEPMANDKSEIITEVNRPVAMSSGPMSQTWTPQLTGYQALSRARRGKKRALTKGFVVITENGSQRWFCPKSFKDTFQIHGSQNYLKPMAITDTFYTFHKCLAIPRAEDGTSLTDHTEVPKSKEEFEQMRAKVLKDKEEFTRTFRTDDWQGDWEIQPGSNTQPRS